jgi:AcrR family transcriptional regulator
MSNVLEKSKKSAPKSSASSIVNPPKKRRNREKEMMRAALLLFARKGYSATSVQDVANAIGVLKGSVYHYIGSKEELLFRIFLDAHVENEIFMEKVTALDLAPKDKLRTYLEHSLLTTLNNIERTTLYFRDWRYLTGKSLAELKSHRAQYSLFLQGLIEAAYEDEGFEGHVNLKHVTSFVVGGINWVADWYRPGSSVSAKSVATDYTELAMAAIFNSSTKKPIGGGRKKS